VSGRRWLVALALLAACMDPEIPDHSLVYDFSDGNGHIFRWPADRLPVRFYADPRGNMSALVQRAIGVWQAQFLYGEFRGTMVADSNQADVIVFWSDSVPPDVPPDNGTPVKACGGLSQVATDSGADSLQLAGPIHSSVSVLINGSTAGQVEACMRRTVIHELGHALGIIQESPNASDIMAVTPLASLPTQRDRETVQVLYHTVPNLRPAPR
jgi:predicted Zn-dependent protease